MYISISMLTFLQTIHSLSINVLNLYDIQKRICLEKSFVLHMLSVLILSQRSLVTMPMARQLLIIQVSIDNFTYTSGPHVQGCGFPTIIFLRAPQVESKLSHEFESGVYNRSKLSITQAFCSLFKCVMLLGEQPRFHPWDLLQPQDMISQHRGAKQFRRYGL